ncbi:hypothetical protein CTI12_AA193040 [Artemisia annua]|uniref:Uncharacterized protein n=1 Tax=Artemisia annua TaxID=35608 RepID=A0A2U1P518_ARTAN|nr:hypothetical protein CTI12_AA193040 [Artemisia annua]
MTCTSFIESFGLKLFQRFSHFLSREVGCKYVSLHHKQPKVSNSSWKSSIEDPALRSSYISNMSVKEGDPVIEKVKEKKEEEFDKTLPQKAPQPSTKQLSVQDRITLFENKQKEIDSLTGSGGKPAVMENELCRQPSDLTHPHSSAPSVVPRRCSGASDTGDEEAELKPKVRTTAVIKSVEAEPKDLESVENQSGEFSLQEKETRKQVQRQSKRNQELNENLFLKADELEKLFAQHKLRIRERQTPRLTYRKQVADPPKMASFIPMDFMPNSRGNSYDSYAKKREARLRELWDRNRATMKLMYDSLTKLSWPISKQDSVTVSHHRAERLRLFLKNKKVLSFPIVMIKDDEGNVSRLLDPKPFVKNRLVKNFSTSTPRTASARILKSTPKVCNAPNLSYLRKDSMKAYSAARKIAA